MGVWVSIKNVTVSEDFSFFFFTFDYIFEHFQFACVSFSDQIFFWLNWKNNNKIEKQEQNTSTERLHNRKNNQNFRKMVHSCDQHRLQFR
jgi:hypothetical protein